MAAFKIIASRQLGLETCEFDVALITGEIVVGELFPIEEIGSLWEYIILSAQSHEGFTTLKCVTWIPQSGIFVGYVASTRQLTAVDKKRYAKVLSSGLTTHSSGSPDAAA